MDDNTFRAVMVICGTIAFCAFLYGLIWWLYHSVPVEPRRPAPAPAPLWSMQTTSYRPSKIPDTAPKEDAVPDRRSIRINVRWTSTGEEDDVEINKAIAHHERTLQLAIASINLRTRPAVSSNEGSRHCFTGDDRLAIGDFLDWMADLEGSSLPKGYSITSIVDEYDEMIRSAQAKPPSGGGGNS
jgi:hypothetical protein